MKSVLALAVLAAISSSALSATDSLELRLVKIDEARVVQVSRCMGTKDACDKNRGVLDTVAGVGGPVSIKRKKDSY